uniref:Carbohydrate sulfotransferase n=1 Tax=Cacopsylla melanoneura TaxID=428564 RepID=A0A8D9EV50_9HEMI
MVRKSNNCCLSIVIFVFPALVIYLNVSSGGPGFKTRPGDSSSRHSRYQNGHYKPASEPINWTVENDKMAARMASRLKTLKENCEKFGLSLPSNDSLHRANTWEFLINKQYRLVWCNVFKAASSSWLFNFNVLAGYSPQFLRRQSQAPALSLARVKYPRPSLSDLESAVSDPAGSVTFVIVRHPFERLLSAYRDKIYNSLPNTVHRSLSSMILRKYRPQAANKSNSRRATFEEFVLYLLDTFRSEESPPGLDMHWAPIVTFCTPCLVNFNVILKDETLQVSYYSEEVTQVGIFLNIRIREDLKFFKFLDRPSCLIFHYSCALF